MTGKGSTVGTGRRDRSDGRRSLLVYLDPELIKGLKKAAVDDDRTVYEIVEGAMRTWLQERGTEGGEKT